MFDPFLIIFGILVLALVNNRNNLEHRTYMKALEIRELEDQIELETLHNERLKLERKGND